MMDGAPDRVVFELHAGDHVALLEDDWSSLDRDIVVVDAEPVPGSTQCLVRVGDDLRTVSRAELRRRSVL